MKKSWWNLGLNPWQWIYSESVPTSTSQFIRKAETWTQRVENLRNIDDLCLYVLFSLFQKLWFFLNPQTFKDFYTRLSFFFLSHILISINFRPLWCLTCCKSTLCNRVTTALSAEFNPQLCSQETEFLTSSFPVSFPLVSGYKMILFRSVWECLRVTTINYLPWNLYLV